MHRLILWSLGLVFCTAAHALTIIDLELATPLSSPTYTFYSYTATTGEQETNIPIGPYTTYLTGGSYNDTQVQAFCYDLNNPTDVGTTYQGTLNTPTDPSDMEATYLINQINVLEKGNNLPLATQGAIDFAIWQIMNASSNNPSNPFPDDPTSQSWITQAQTAVTDGWWTAADSAVYPVWEPTSANSGVQRFGLILPGTSPVPTPEPGTCVLIGLGMIGLSLALRRKRRQVD